MDVRRLHRASLNVLIGLSAIALLTVGSGYFQPPEPDEGTGAHVFQLCIVTLLPTALLFLATADWNHPVRIARALAVPVTLTILAFGALYYLEHYYYLQHYR